MVYPRFQSRPTAVFPLGLGYIGAVLAREGHEVGLVDCPVEGYDIRNDLGKDRVVYGLTAAEIRRRIEAFRPDLIGISCLFCTLHKRMLAIAQLAKEVDPNIIVVCGGPHVSACYRQVITHSEIDFCVIGEGEVAIAALGRALTAGHGLEAVKGLCYRRGSQIVVQPRDGYIENLDGVPFPARDLVDMETYFRIAEPQGLRLDGERRVRVAQMTTSRGCPFRCKYCGKDATWGTAYRTRSPQNVLDEMELLIERYGVEHIAFQDDNLTADMERAAAIFAGIIEHKLPITWEAPNGLGVNFLNPGLLEAMKASGCTSFTIAVESGSPEILRRVNKPNYTRLAPPLVRKARELGIEVRGFFMIGFPGETLEQVHETVRYARELSLAVKNFALVTPFPGTPLFQECVDGGLVDSASLDLEDFTYGSLGVQLAAVPNEQLMAIRKIEWMRGIFLDEHGRFRRDLGLKKRDVLDEIAKGRALYPDDPDIAHIEAEALAHFGAAGSSSTSAAT